jgi:hypothetical protein
LLDIIITTKEGGGKGIENKEGKEREGKGRKGSEGKGSTLLMKTKEYPLLLLVLVLTTTTLLCSIGFTIKL